MERPNQTICLCMIVKNEAHVIRETLECVHKYIDYYVINDTGSTDNTIEVIKTFFNEKNIKGEVVEHEFRTCKCHGPEYKKYKWFHFGWNRTYALNQCVGKSDYIMIMDADDLIHGNLVLPKFMDKDSYDVKFGSTSTYYRPFIIKNDKNLDWAYFGGLHEYLASKTATNLQNEILTGDYYMECRHLGDRSNVSDKYAKDAEIFEELMLEEPKNDRYVFYGAQSYFSAGMYEKSMELYKKRTTMGSWWEEVYFSYYRIAVCKMYLNKSEDEITGAFTECYNKYPTRIEPIYEIVKYYRIKNKFQEGWLYYWEMKKMTFPKECRLFVEKSVYDYQLYDELSICAYYCGKYQESYDLGMKILTEKKYPPEHKNRLENNIKFSIDKINSNKYVETKSNTDKPKLIIYIGYTPDFTVSNKNCYGSELATFELAKEFTKIYDVYIFGTQIFNKKIVDNIIFMNSSQLMNFQENNKIDVLIVSRYIHFFVEFKSLAKKTYLWFHDNYAHSYWHGLAFPETGKYLLQNVIDKINGVITLSNWHRNLILSHYKFNPKKVLIIGNAINTTKLQNISRNKIKNSFAYVSSPNRGLKQLINHFHTIKQKLDGAQLFIYRDIDDFTDKTILDEIKKYDYIHFQGKKENIELINELGKIEFWYYPTDCTETYCISALEAQFAGCVCISSHLGGLEDTIADRGFLIKSKPYSEQYFNEALKYISTVNENETIKENCKNKAIEWAKTQTWTTRAQEWIDLFKK